jgi:hypothetical protein
MLIVPLAIISFISAVSKLYFYFNLKSKSNMVFALNTAAF